MYKGKWGACGARAEPRAPGLVGWVPTHGLSSSPLPATEPKPDVPSNCLPHCLLGSGGEPGKMLDGQSWILFPFAVFKKPTSAPYLFKTKNVRAVCKGKGPLSIFQEPPATPF